MSVRLVRSATAALLLCLLGAACAGGDSPTAPTAATPPAARSGDLLGLGGLLGSVTRLVCPSPDSASASAVIGPQGGTLATDGVLVQFPAGAVPDSQTFTARVVPGTYVNVELAAQGYEHYTFATPVTVTLDLSRCGLLPPGLRAWYFDEQTQALLEDMGGTLDLLGGSIRFRTPHFSGYTVAW